MNEPLKRREADEVKTEQARTAIASAKEMIMRHYSMTEDEAYKFMRKKSMDNRIPMEQLAEKIFREEVEGLKS